VVHGDVVDQLHDNHSLADTSTAEKTDLTSLGVGGKQIDNLDTSHKNLLRLALLGEEGGGSVDGGLRVALNGALLVDGLTDDVQNST
jgi:hypothetical protein